MDWELGRAQGGRYPTVATQQQPKNGDVKYEMNAAGYLEEWQYQASSGINPFTGEMESGGWKRIAAYNMPGSGGSTGATWKPGEQEQEESKLTLSWLKYQSDLLKDQQSALSDEWQNAVMEGDLKRQMAADAEIKRNNAEINRLNAQRNAIEVYSSQLTSRASLASTAANVATTASEWAANPRNEAALLKLQETGLLGGSATPLNAAQYNPETMGAYGTALDQRFQDLFGGVGKQLADALAATNQTPVAAQPWYQSDPNYGSLNPNQQAIARNYSPEERGQYQNFMNMTPLEKSYVTGRGGNVAPTAQQSQDVYAGLSDEGKRYVQEMAKRGTPSMAGGGKMTVNEPTGLVGLISKKLFATIAESEPEQVTITPMKQPKQGEGGGIPGVQSFATGGTINNHLMSPEAVKNLMANYGKPGPMRQHSIDAAAGRTSYTAKGKGFTLGNQYGETMTDPGFRAARHRYDTTPGGIPVGAYTPTAPTTPTRPAATADTPEMKLAKQFAATLKPLGIDFTPSPGNYAPPPNLLVGKSWANLQKYPSILAMLEAMASLSGEPWGDFSSDVNMFQPTAPRYSSVSYGW
jgi:hypothetical protein